MSQSQKKKEEKTTERNKIKTDIINRRMREDNTSDKHSKDVQSALVLQGGGALAAYEVGVYAALYFWRKKEIEKKDVGNNEGHIFDIISGTSGGAINGWILINHVLTRINQGHSITESWKGSLKKLLDFWDYTSSSPDFTKWGPYSIALEVENIPGFPPYAILKWPSGEEAWISRWDKEHQRAIGSPGTRETKKSTATGEAARRYYSAKEYLYSGADNVFSRLPKKYDNRFFDDLFPPSNTWYRYSNHPLRASIDKFSNLKSIATTYSDDGNNRKGSVPEGQEINEIAGPRLLVVAVDVEKGQDITFDSYEKKDGARRSDYHEYDELINEDKSSLPPFTLTYNEGITLDHVMASASVPVHYDYAPVPIDSSKPSKGSKAFWDGGILSNTPLRELIQAHEDYWTKGRNRGIPNLEVYIANIWPSKWKDVPSDHDAVRDRRFDLEYKDKTLQEEKIAYLIHDYIELANKLKDLARERGATEKDIGDYLNQHLETKSKHRNGQNRTHQELLQNKVEITKVIRIERHYDPNDISYKWCDYSQRTVTHMIERGIEEALEHLIKREENESRPHHLPFDKRKELEKFINLIDREKEAEGLARNESRILTKSAADLLKEAAVKIIQSST